MASYISLVWLTTLMTCSLINTKNKQPQKTTATTNIQWLLRVKTTKKSVHNLLHMWCFLFNLNELGAILRMLSFLSFPFPSSPMWGGCRVGGGLVLACLMVFGLMHNNGNISYTKHIQSFVKCYKKVSWCVSWRNTLCSFTGTPHVVP